MQNPTLENKVRSLVRFFYQHKTELKNLSVESILNRWMLLANYRECSLEEVAAFLSLIGVMKDAPGRFLSEAAYISGYTDEPSEGYMEMLQNL